MSESTEDVVKTACAELSKCSCDKHRKDNYKLNLQKYSLVDEVLPITRPRLLEAFSDPDVNDEILRQVARRRLLTEIELERLLPKPLLSRKCTRHCDRESTDGLAEYNKVKSLVDYHIKSYCLANNLQNEQLVRTLSNGKDIGTYKRRNCNNKAILLKRQCLVTLAAGICLGVMLACIAALAMVGAASDYGIIKQNFKSCLPTLHTSAQVIRSLDEYNETARKRIKNMMNMVAHILEPNDWPIGVHIEQMNNLQEIQISGKMHGNKVVDLLANTPEVNEITINNRCNMICSETKIPTARQKRDAFNISANKLNIESVELECDSLLSILEKQVVFTNLEELVLRESNINWIIAVQIVNILTKTSTSIKRIEIHNSTTNSTILNFEKLTVFPNATSVTLDIATNLAPVINKDFCQTFPNLEHISFGNEARVWSNDLENILNCSKLKRLNFKLMMPSNQVNFSVGFLSRSFPLLQSAEIHLTFPRCALAMNSWSNGNFVLGIKNLSEILLVNLGIRSNCKLKYE